RFYTEALATKRRILGDGHPLTVATLNDFAVNTMKWGELEQADALFDEARRLGRGVSAPIPLCIIEYNSARLKRTLGQKNEARTLLRQAIQDAGENDHVRALATTLLARMSVDQGNLAVAEQLLRENAVKLKRLPRIDPLARVSCLFELAEVT